MNEGEASGEGLRKVLVLEKERFGEALSGSEAPLLQREACALIGAWGLFGPFDSLTSRGGLKTRVVGVDQGGVEEVILQIVLSVEGSFGECLHGPQRIDEPILYQEETSPLKGSRLGPNRDVFQEITLGVQRKDEEEEKKRGKRFFDHRASLSKIRSVKATVSHSLSEDCREDRFLCFCGGMRREGPKDEP